MLVLPKSYVFASDEGVGRQRIWRAEEASARGLRVVRVGVLNVMPKAESYEPYLLRPLLQADTVVEPVWLRLESHRYASSDAAHIQHYYRSFAQAIGEQPLDGLILTGAPGRSRLRGGALLA